MVDAAELTVRALAKVVPHWGMEAFWHRQRGGDTAMRVVDATVRAGDVVADVGASFGLYTSRLARIVGSSGRVHSFEPNPQNFRRLERVRAGRDHVVLHPCGLSDRSGRAELHVPVVDDEEKREQASLVAPGERFARSNEVPVEVARLDEVLADDPPSFVKCDVEGHEHAVLRGGEAILRRSHPVLLIEIEQRHRREPVEVTLDYLAELDYDAYTLAEGGLQPADHFDVDRDQAIPLSRHDAPGVPPGYVNNFLLVPAGAQPPQLG